MFRKRQLIHDAANNPNLDSARTCKTNYMRACPSDYYFFAMKLASDPHRLAMQISGDDPRKAIRAAAVGEKRGGGLLSRKSVCRTGIALGLLLIGGPLALAQSAPPPPRGDAMLGNGPPVWDANHDGVYTCDEWKKYADRLFTSADRNRDGNLDKSEFEMVRKADATLAEADFGYFDENQDGKITRKEFVEKPSAFILRFDRNGDCRVTPDEIKAGTAPKPTGGPVERPRDRFH
jgi:hypothetical protein